MPLSNTFRKSIDKKADTTFGGVSVLPPFSEYILPFSLSSEKQKGAPEGKSYSLFSYRREKKRTFGRRGLASYPNLVPLDARELGLFLEGMLQRECYKS